MKALMCFDDLAVGDRWVSKSRHVTEADVVQFADLTGDYNPLHLDEDYARQTPFRQPIAHGLLGLSLVAGLSSEYPRVDTVAFLGIVDWEFCRPVYFDNEIHVVTTVARLTPRGKRRGEVLWRCQLVSDQDEVLQQGTLKSLVACRAASLHAATSSGSEANGSAHPL